jgi:hypothetical protein
MLNTTKHPAYVQAIMTERDEAQARLVELNEKIADLSRYLNSDKFSKDPTVQVADVLTRLGLR